MANPLIAFLGRQVIKGAGKVAKKLAKINRARPNNTGQGMSFEPKGIINKFKNKVQRGKVETKLQGRGKQSVYSPHKQQFEMITKQSTDSMTLIKKHKVK
jgi:hypothetical protein